MCSSEGHQAVSTQEEGTTEVETPSFAPYRTSQSSHLSDSSNFTTHSTMPADHAELSTRRLRSHDVVRGSPKQTSKEIPSVPVLPDPSSPLVQYPKFNPSNAAEDCFETEIHPTTVRTAWIINRPSSREEIEVAIDIIKEEFDSDCPPPSQYLLVKCIPSKLFKALLKDQETPKGVCVLILHHKQEILYRIMPGAWHQLIVQRFNRWIDITLGAMGVSFWDSNPPDYDLAGSTRRIGCSSEKEPDSSFYPGGLPVPEGPVVLWPSLVLEAGVSESLAQLRADAQWWYANSGHRTKIVVLIYAPSHSQPNSQSPSQFHSRDVSIEIWTEVESQSELRTRGRQSQVLQCTQRASFTNGVVSGPVLVIPFQTLMRRPAQNPAETDLELTPEFILRICR
ncbi:unnamed protein product [Penicillium salamii]|uniref:Uncharacterized protein n=1 Tax=Penicillium salamii TaxID=1612424 RepID=A0A9W4JMM0_9EURO|nr:unnamed protein product [Penicillium salamii]CAG8302000.1 unnamed protein product [Penicillium salamii]CAG8354378.1 unnamed protein product [Penicillium salamii]CAG8360092.1 unnamed protein product [Penicillium salamii]CAG8367506.1 unnamed protein product [Penicillium salamii]